MIDKPNPGHKFTADYFQANPASMAGIALRHREPAKRNMRAMRRKLCPICNKNKPAAWLKKHVAECKGK